MLLEPFFITPGVAWWGMLVLILASISALLGVLYALMEHDMKRLLAYHSVENIGIILIGVGVSMIFMASGHPDVAAFGLMAGLYHTINHAIFTSQIEPVFERYLYNPVIWVVMNGSRFMRIIQTGYLQTYLLYILLTLVISLIYVAKQHQL